MNTPKTAGIAYVVFGKLISSDRAEGDQPRPEVEGDLKHPVSKN